jgi:ABC-type transport system involved in cytochrome bd biosynthesis fused ATPase/permease subunit
VTPWKIPLVVAAIAVPIAVSFLTVGPALGMAAGALAAVAIVAVAANQQPRGTIGGEDSADIRRVLVVVGDPLEDTAAVEEVAAVVRTNGASEVMVLAPARIGFLDRWASDVEAARRDAQRRLVISVASLAAAGVEAEARVGDEDVVQAVEDQLGSFPAAEVILVSAGGEEDPAAAAAASELRSRLRAKFRWVLSGPADH